MKIVVLEGDAVGTGVSYDCLAQYGELVICGNAKPEEVKELIKDAEIVVANKLLMNESVLAGSKVRLIAEAATGYNNIDLDYCKKQGITVTNVKGYSTESVAQHTIAMLLYVYEKLDYYNDFVTSGTYADTTSFSHLDRQFFELSGKTWGIVGMGNIGREVAKIATAFGCKVIYYSASGNSYDVPYEQVSFDELLVQSDVVSLHCPLTPVTNGMFGYEQFCKMKKEAVIVNVARGPIIKDADLARALQEGIIAGAGLDVFGVEPMLKENPLLKVQDKTALIMTPHIGWGSLEARARLIEDVRKSIEAFLAGAPRSVVN